MPIEDFKWTTILYEGLVATGEVLLPIIFTNCPEIPADFDKDLEAKVFFIPGLKAPSGDLTLHWLEAVDFSLEEGSVIGHDRGPEYTAEVVQKELETRGYRPEKMPSSGGAFVNPCDNSFNSVLSRAYWSSDHKTYEDKLRAIIKAYYASSGETICHYFRHTGWIGDQPTRISVQHLLAEGYQPGKKHKELYDEMLHKYRAWKKHLRDAPEGADRPEHL